MYSLHAGADDRELGTATHLVDFFVESDDEWRTFGIAGFTPAGTDLPATADLLRIRVRGTGGEILGEYSVSDAEIEAAAVPRVTGYLLDTARPGGEAAWQRLRSGGLREPGSWQTLPVADRPAWLDAVRMHADLLPAGPADVSGGVYELVGRDIVDETSFYCAVGEALRGPGGYFGAVSQAFADCLHGGFGVKPPFELRWHAAETARAALGEALFEEITGTLRGAGVSVTPLP